MRKKMRSTKSPKSRKYAARQTIDRTLIENHKKSNYHCQQVRDESFVVGGLSVSKLQQLFALLVVIIFLVTFASLMVAALITQNLFLLSFVPLMAHEIAYLFRKAVDYLFPLDNGLVILPVKAQ